MIDLPGTILILLLTLSGALGVWVGWHMGHADRDTTPHPAYTPPPHRRQDQP